MNVSLKSEKEEKEGESNGHGDDCGRRGTAI